MSVPGFGVGPDAVPDVVCGGSAVPGFKPVPGFRAGPDVVPEVMGGEPGVLSPSGLSGSGTSRACSCSKVASMWTSGGMIAGGTIEGGLLWSEDAVPAPSVQSLWGCTD